MPLHNAPTVYIPVAPEGDGLSLPVVLSTLAHALIIGALIYAYYHHAPEDTGSMETVMVSPEQLAQIQSNILANRAASASSSAANEDASSPSADIAPHDELSPTGGVEYERLDMQSEMDTTNQSMTAPNSQREPVFLPSDEPSEVITSDNAPILMSQEQQEALSEAARLHEQEMQEWRREQDRLAAERLEQVQQNRQRVSDEEQRRLAALRQKSNNPPKIERPNSTQKNINITSGSGKSLSLSDGASTLAGELATQSPQIGHDYSASSGRTGASNSEIISMIRRNYNPPVAARGSTQRATLTITVDAGGNVVSVKASGSDNAVNDAARAAVLATGRFPIGTDDPKYPTFSVQFNGSN